MHIRINPRKKRRNNFFLLSLLPLHAPAQFLVGPGKVLGGEGAAIPGPDGITVGITAKNLGAHLRLDRAPVLPFLPETIADPYEIWLMPYRDALTGRVELRRRYIKGLALDKKLFTWFIGEYRQGEVQDVTLIRTSRAGEIQKQRAGILVYGRKMSK